MKPDGLDETRPCARRTVAFVDAAGNQRTGETDELLFEIDSLADRIQISVNEAT